MTRIYKKTKNFLLYTVVFGAALSVSSFLANVFMARSMTQGRIAASPIPFTPIASADIPTGTWNDGTFVGDDYSPTEGDDSDNGDDGDIGDDSDSDGLW